MLTIVSDKENKLIAEYLEWVNDYLTIEVFAATKEYTYDEALDRIKQGNEVYNRLLLKEARG